MLLVETRRQSHMSLLISHFWTATVLTFFKKRLRVVQENGTQNDT